MSTDISGTALDFSPLLFTPFHEDIAIPNWNLDMMRFPPRELPSGGMVEPHPSETNMT